MSTRSALAFSACIAAVALCSSPARASGCSVADQSGELLFEDNWPQDGDLDFNDQTVAHDFQFKLDGSGNVVTLQATFSVLASGATFHNGLYLHLPLPANTGLTATDQDGNAVYPVSGETDLVFPIAADTRALFATQYPFINTVSTTPAQTPKTLSLTLQFAAAQTLEMDLAPFDLFIARASPKNNGKQLQVHRPQYAGTNAMDTSLFNTSSDRSANGLHFINENGLPFVLTLPSAIAWPQEKVSISSVYPDISTFASSGGAMDKDWYETDIDAQLSFTTGAGIAAPTPASPAALTCPAPNPQAFSLTGGVQTFTVPAGVTTLHFKLWGGGGGGGGYESIGFPAYSGGAGGFVSGSLAVSPGDQLFLYIAGGGASAGANANGGYQAPVGGGYPDGAGATAPSCSAGGGGTWLTNSGGTLMAIAGGGGGGGSAPDAVSTGGAGGGAVGQSGSGVAPGTGGTQNGGGTGGTGASDQGGNGGYLAGGVTAEQYFSGVAIGSNGGGGGYYGGGAGGNDFGHNARVGGAGGGSSYIGGAAVSGASSVTGAGAVPPSTSDSDYVAGVAIGGIGGGAPGGNGLAVLSW